MMDTVLLTGCTVFLICATTLNPFYNLDLVRIIITVLLKKIVCCLIFPIIVVY